MPQNNPRFRANSFRVFKPDRYIKAPTKNKSNGRYEWKPKHFEIFAQALQFKKDIKADEFKRAVGWGKVSNDAINYQLNKHREKLGPKKRSSGRSEALRNYSSEAARRGAADNADEDEEEEEDEDEDFEEGDEINEEEYMANSDLRRYGEDSTPVPSDGEEVDENEFEMLLSEKDNPDLYFQRQPESSAVQPNQKATRPRLGAVQQGSAAGLPQASTSAPMFGWKAAAAVADGGSSSSSHSVKAQARLPSASSAAPPAISPNSAPPVNNSAAQPSTSGPRHSAPPGSDIRVHVWNDLTEEQQQIVFLSFFHVFWFEDVVVFVLFKNMPRHSVTISGTYKHIVLRCTSHGFMIKELERFAAFADKTETNFHVGNKSMENRQRYEEWIFHPPPNHLFVPEKDYQKKNIYDRPLNPKAPEDRHKVFKCVTVQLMNVEE